MIKSMTGYGRAEVKDGAKGCIVEIRSVNHRYLEVALKFSKRLNSLEEKIKKVVKNEISRGYVEIFIKLEDATLINKKIIPDMDLVQQLYAGIRQVKDDLKLTGEVDLQTILSYRDIFKIEEIEKDLNGDEKIIDQTLRQALQDLKKMREEEGKSLFTDLENRIGKIEDTCTSVKQIIPKSIEDYRLKLTQRIKEVLKEEIDEARIAQEIVFFADRSDVSEELTRLESHCRQFLNTLNSEGPIGKKIEFILQEINREINTLGSKCNDFQISEKVIGMKCEVEKIREQIQNIE